MPIGSAIAPKFPMLWFSRDSAAGVLVSNQAGTVPFTGKFASFGITPAP